MTRRNDKRSRLIQAAVQLFQQQGVNITTLANIAALANVPLGNVYYYFKSKESIINAVVELHIQHLKERFQEWEAAFQQGKDRLAALIRHQNTVSEQTIHSGEPIGALCQELSKQTGKLPELSMALMQELYQWCQVQFKQFGKSDSEAGVYANHLLSALLGNGIVTLTFKDSAFTKNQTQVLLEWLTKL